MKHTFRLLSTLTLLALSAPLLAQQANEAPVSPPTVAEPAPAVEPASEAAPAVAELDRSTLKYSNKWRIKFSGEAKSDGVLAFRMVMKDAEPVVVSIDIKDGTNDDNIADKVEKAMKNAFPRDFNVEVDDGESVLVKLNIVEGSSSIELLENTVAKVKVRIKKE
jgi:hypothetical protein